MKKVASKKVKSLDGVIDSGLSRIGEWVGKADVAMLTAFRGKLVDCVSGADGSTLTKKTNMARNKELLSVLLAKGYGVTAIDGSYVEGFGGDAAKEVKENSFFVVNLNNDTDFVSTIQKLGERYCQDSVFIKKQGEVAYLLGTNYNDFPGYKKESKLSGFKPGKEAEFMSRIKGRPYNFGDNTDLIVQLFLGIGVPVLHDWDSSSVNTKFLIKKEAGEALSWLDNHKGYE